MKFGASVVAAPFRMFGYSFNFIQNETSRQIFMDRFKSAVPLKMWDSGAKRWWVPELYGHIVETLAQDAGALDAKALQQAAALRVQHMRAVPMTGPDAKPVLEAYTVLGLLPSVPRPLVHAAIAHWRNHFSSIPLAVIEAQRAEDAYTMIQDYWREQDALGAAKVGMEDLLEVPF
jgi:hypothetical protein